MTDPFAELSPPYSTIVADPPWKYNAAKGVPTNGFKPSTAEAHYSTMTMGEIAALPVAGLAADNAHLYMWVTNPRLFGDRKDDGHSPLSIVEAWGFEYRTLLTWDKTGAIGMGWYFRGATEHVLFCTRGKAPIPAADREPNIFRSRRRRHSAKPPVFFDLVEGVSPGPYVELFSRTPRLGWDAWGKGYELSPAAGGTR